MPNPEYVVVIDYTNHRGERSLRRIVPHRLVWESNEWHKQAQWLIYAYDVEKDAERSFAVKDVHSWKPFVEPEVDENLWLMHCRHAQSCYRHGQCMYGCPLKDNSKLKDWMEQEAGLRMESI